MIIISVIDIKKNKSFDKSFDNLKDARRFILRCGYGNSLFVEAIHCEHEEDKQELLKIW